MPLEVGYRTCIYHPLGTSLWSGDPNSPLVLDVLVKGPVLLQLFIRGNPFQGNLYREEPWLSAIIVPSEDIINKKGCLNIISNIIRRINKSLSNIEKIRKYIVIKIPFSIDNGQLTPSLKVRRHKVLEAYGSKLDNLYKG